MTKSDNIFFVVSKIYGAFYEVFHHNHGILQCTLRGKLRQKKNDERHLLVVGDKVSVENSGKDQWVITDQIARSNQLERMSKAGNKQVLCSNVDQVLILASLKDPETKTGFIDRCLAAVHKSSISPVIIFTKKDLAQAEYTSEFLKSYELLGYQVYAISIFDPEDIKNIRSILKDKTSFIVGNSGVGKSSLINLILDSDSQKVSNVSHYTSKGKHTTTNTSLFNYNNEFQIIDSPGIKEWGILHLEVSEILESFPELHPIKEKCKEPNCCHGKNSCSMRNEKNTKIHNEERLKNLDSMISSLSQPYRTSRRDNLRRGNGDWEEDEF